MLGSAVLISDMFIDDGRIVSIRPRVGKEYVYNGETENSFTRFPMVVLINGYSASGAEIVAACLQDHGRALILGTRSYGKGSVQTIGFFAEGKLKMTTASYWRPSGKNINKPSTGGKDDDEWGVSPDPGYVVKLPPAEREELYEHLREQDVIGRKENSSKKEYKDKQLDTALTYLRGQIKASTTAKKARKAANHTLGEGGRPSRSRPLHLSTSTLCCFHFHSSLFAHQPLSMISRTDVRPRLSSGIWRPEHVSISLSVQAFLHTRICHDQFAVHTRGVRSRSWANERRHAALTSVIQRRTGAAECRCASALALQDNAGRVGGDLAADARSRGLVPPWRAAAAGATTSGAPALCAAVMQA